MAVSLLGLLGECGCVSCPGIVDVCFLVFVLCVAMLWYCKRLVFDILVALLVWLSCW